MAQRNTDKDRALQTGWRQTLFSDWTVTVDDRTYHLHKLRLATGPRLSEFFLNLFLTNPNLPFTSTDLSGCPPACKERHVFEAFLDFIYDDTLSPAPRLAVPLLRLARQLMVEPLCTRLVGYIRGNMTVHAPMFLLAALELEEEMVIEEAVELMAKNFVVYSSFLISHVKQIPVDCLVHLFSRASVTTGGEQISHFAKKTIEEYEESLELQEFSDLIHSLKFISTEDALFFFKKTLSKKGCKLSKTVLDVVVQQFPFLEFSDIVGIPPEYVISILSRNDLIASEDHIYKAIHRYISENSEKLSAEHISGLWGCCRFFHLSPETLRKAEESSLVPKALLLEAVVARVAAHESPEVFKNYSVAPMRGKPSEPKNNVPTVGKDTKVNDNGSGEIGNSKPPAHKNTRRRRKK